MSDLTPEPSTDTGERLEEVVSLLTRLVEATEAGTAAVARESRGRKLSIALLAVALVGLMSVGFFAVIDRIDRNEITCEERIRSRNDLRGAVAGALLLVADFYDVPVSEQAELREAIEAELLEMYPAPDC